MGADQVVEEAAFISRIQALVAGEGQLVLGQALDLPALGHFFAVLAHGQAGARLAIARQQRFEQHRWAYVHQGLELVAQAFGAIGRKQGMAQGFVDANGRVGGGVGTTGNAHFDLAEGDFIRHQQRSFKPCATGLLHIIGRGLRRQRGGQQRLAGQVEIP